MAHDLMHNHMAYVEEVPWHGLGKKVSSNVTAPEMITAAGLDWEVKKVPAPGARDDGKGRYHRYLVVREQTAHEPEDVVLGVVGHGYEILQNDKAFDFFEPFIASRAARFETAGALRDGERVWVLAKLADPIRVIGDDVVDRYLLLLEFTRRSRCRLHSVHAGPCCLSEHPQPCNQRRKRRHSRTPYAADVSTA